MDKSVMKLIADNFGELNRKMDFYRDEIGELNKKIDTYREEIDEFKDGAYKKLDDTYGEVIKMREEQGGHFTAHEDIAKDVDDLKSRLTIVENTSVIASEINKKK